MGFRAWGEEKGGQLPVKGTLCIYSFAYCQKPTFDSDIYRREGLGSRFNIVSEGCGIRVRGLLNNYNPGCGNTRDRGGIKK